MLREKTVLLLGAGASHPYKFPIGQELITNIARGLASLPDEASYNSITGVNVLERPQAGALAIANWKKPGWIHPNFFTAGIHAWKQLGERLLNDPCPSIDEFARANPTQAGAIKLLIAAEIASHTYDAATLSQRGGLAPNAQITRNTRQNWYGKFLTQIRRHFRDAKAFDPSQPLTVVTFNYDRSLEIFLASEMPRAEIYNDVNWSDAVSVIHVHGEVKCDPKHDGRAMEVHLAEGLLASAETMLVVDDRRHPQDPAKVAMHYLSEADHIVAIGFDFHEQNVDLLNLSDQACASRVRALNFTGSPGFDRKAVRAGVAKENIWKRSGNYPITEAIDHGFFEA